MHNSNGQEIIDLLQTVAEGDIIEASSYYLKAKIYHATIEFKAEAAMVEEFVLDRATGIKLRVLYEGMEVYGYTAGMIDEKTERGIIACLRSFEQKHCSIQFNSHKKGKIDFQRILKHQTAQLAK